MTNRIKRLDEFELNEGVLRSIFGGVANLFKTKKNRISSILKKIKNAKIEDVNNRIEIEKKITGLHKENTPEYRFDITNLNRQIEVFSSMKNLEISNLIKEAEDIIEGDPKLISFFSSEVASIEADAVENLIKNIKPYAESSHLDQLNAEFDRLTKDANKKEQLYKEYETEIESKEKELYKISTQASSFIDLNSQEAKQFLKELDTKPLNSLHSEIRDLFFDLEYDYDNKINRIRSQIKKAKREGNDFFVPSLEKEEDMIKSKYKKTLDSIRYKLNLIDKELKVKKYGNY